MKKLIRFVVVILILVGALAFFKPSASNFETWLKKEAAHDREEAKGDNIVEKLVDKGLTTATQLQILATYQYSDHKIAAIVEANANGEKLKFLGVATFWIPLP
ncbi:MAG: hypothetical protein ACERKD_15360 [Prolixibacteraceae bacterium]